MNSDGTNPGKKKTLLIFTGTILFGFVLFALPNLFFGITKWNGGLSGVNLLYIALFQLITVGTLIYYSLRRLNMNFRSIGWTGEKWNSDTVLGLVTGLSWTALQFAWIIPATGGAERTDIAQMVTMLDGSIAGVLFFIALGVIGGGITEEIYNRGYFITVLKDVFKNPKTGLWIASILSILFFALGHLPGDALGWFDILVPTIAYTLLFIFTGRLTAPIIAHGIYNMSAILLVWFIYYP